LKDKCGIVGITSNDQKTALYIYYALYALQHRGQESAGIATTGKGIHVIKEMGLVSEVFDNRKLGELCGDKGIGHVRYSTTGLSSIESSQPLRINYKDGTLVIAHNGNIVNSRQLRRELELEGKIFHSDSDTEVIAHLLVKELMRGDYVEAIAEVMRRLIGSYSFTLLVDDTLIAVRDPLGFKPLCIGEIDGGYIVASESAAIETLNGKFIRDVQPGEILVINDHLTSHRIYKSVNKAYCVFEYIYFARPDSVLDGKLVYDVRMNIGETLAEEYEVNGDIVSPIPDSGVTFAIGYAKRSGIEYMEGLIKNRYIGRTFILPNQMQREISVGLKLNVIRKNVKDKRIVLVDDSIVRGVTSMRMIDCIRNMGAKEIHMRIGSPPIISPCYMGIDISSRSELIAAYKNVDDVRKLVHSDSLGYVSIDGLVRSIGIPAEDLCMGCLTGIYPIEIPGEECAIRQSKLTQF
jgi:amidophosphoribosyltransferase